jgi:hypothetical protein
MCFSRIKNIKSLTFKNSGTLIVIQQYIYNIHTQKYGELTKNRFCDSDVIGSAVAKIGGDFMFEYRCEFEAIFIKARVSGAQGKLFDKILTAVRKANIFAYKAEMAWRHEERKIL